MVFRVAGETHGFRSQGVERELHRGGRRFMATWREDEEDAAITRQKREDEDGFHSKGVNCAGVRSTLKATPFDTA